MSSNRNFNKSPWGVVRWLAILGFAARAFSQVVLVPLVSFTDTNRPFAGAVPEGRLLQTPDGAFYGTTIAGGSNGFGTVFRISSNSTFTTVYDFVERDSAYPQAGLVLGSDSNLYGTTSSQPGTVFRITKEGIFSVIFSFNWTNGNSPNQLVTGSDGNLYGTTYYGGANGNGTVFKLSTNGVLTMLYSFGEIMDANQIPLDGANPQAALVQGSDGDFYATTSLGGTKGGYGTVFRISPTGVFRTLVSFNGTNGAQPLSTLVEGPDQALYGTTSSGGALFDGHDFSGLGTVFKVTRSGELTTLHYFNGYPSDGASPSFIGLAQGTDGQLYGTTFYGGADGSGTAFRLASDGLLTLLYSFSRPDVVSGTNLDGYEPIAGLAQGQDGNLYGVASRGGTFGVGTLFCLQSSSFALPHIQSITRTNGTTHLLWRPLLGRTYQVHYSADLNQSNWNNLGPATLATSSTAEAIDAGSSGAQRFYRLLLLP